MTEYTFSKIEKKWQARWEERRDYCVDIGSSKPKMYLLVEFPYPSGAGLHVGHPRSYVAMDIMARKRRMEGFEVLFPIGFDAFGLPVENYAIKTNIHPRITTEENISNFRRQLRMMGISFDWEREVNTTDPDYYKWTQSIFLKMFKAGLAYKKNIPINWCPSCKTALANEEVLTGLCKRCNNVVVQRNKEQWMLRITQYANRLIKDLDNVDYIPAVVEQQRNWIGRSDGTEIDFILDGIDEKLTVFTTRPDTLFGVTYLVIAPEHQLIEKYSSHITNYTEIKNYQAQTTTKTDLQRSGQSDEKTGILINGIEVIHPVTGNKLPVWVADYVLSHYGSGAIMAVPGHDIRDWEFASKFNLPIIEVVQGGDVAKEAFINTEGVLVNSGMLNGLKVPDAIEAITAWLQEKGNGRATTTYQLRDWVFSRQRYWGEPIPLVLCPSCGWVPIPEEQLPVLLPDMEEFKPSSDDISPLKNITSWVQTKCPTCQGPAERETDTMPQWAGSCWYFLRYLDPANSEELVNPEILKRWMPVDWYNGGMEHTTLHLLYSRFWYKFLYDEGDVPTSEPYKRRTSHGMILGNDGEKMSKSRGNVVNPDQVILDYGADTFRAYEMFLGDFDKTATWNDKGVIGINRFLKKVWRLSGKVDTENLVTENDKRLISRVISDVDTRIERMKFNTALSALMEYVNSFSKRDRIPKALIETLSILLFPFTPHLAEEIWVGLGREEPLVSQPWPKADPNYLKKDVVTMAVQVNGKMRGTVEVGSKMDKNSVTASVLKESFIKSLVKSDEIKRVIFVPGKIISLII